MGKCKSNKKRFTIYLVKYEKEKTIEVSKKKCVIGVIHQKKIMVSRNTLFLL